MHAIDIIQTLDEWIKEPYAETIRKRQIGPLTVHRGYANRLTRERPQADPHRFMIEIKEREFVSIFRNISRNDIGALWNVPLMRGGYRMGTTSATVTGNQGSYRFGIGGKKQGRQRRFMHKLVEFAHDPVIVLGDEPVFTTDSDRLVVVMEFIRENEELARKNRK